LRARAALLLVTAIPLTACGGSGQLSATDFGRAANKVCDDGARGVAKAIQGAPSPDVRLARAQAAHAKARAAFDRLRPGEGPADEVAKLSAALHEQGRWFTRAVAAVRRSPKPDPGGVVGRVELEGTLMKTAATAVGAARCARMAEAATQAVARDQYATSVRAWLPQLTRAVARTGTLRGTDRRVLSLEAERQSDVWDDVQYRFQDFEPPVALEDDHAAMVHLLETLNYSSSDVPDGFANFAPRRAARAVRQYNRALRRVAGARRELIDALGEDPPGLREPEAPDPDLGTPS
jgi:hypothetical protein